MRKNFNEKISVYPILLLVLSLLANCKSKDNLLVEAPWIGFNDYRDSKIECSQFIAHIDTLMLCADSVYVSQIQDFCVDDSCIYVLDKAKSIYLFHSSNGRLLKKVQLVGRGRSEYLNPQAIEVLDGIVYVLDMDGRCVLKYDMELNFLDRIKIAFAPLDFMKVDGGFLFYNLTPSERLKRIVHTDEQGSVLNSFLTDQQETDLLLTDKVFCRNGRNGYYISEPVSDVVHEWKDNRVSEMFRFDLGKEDDRKISKTSELITKEGVNILYSLVSSDYVVTLFLANGFLFTNLYRMADETSLTGLADTHLPYPFFPKKISGNTLFGLYEQRDHHNLMMVSYHLL